MSCEEMHVILDNLTAKSQDRKFYAKEAIEIHEQIIQKLKRKFSEFNTFFKGTCLGGSYLDDLTVVNPEEYLVYFMFKLPYPVKVETFESFSPYLYLRAPDGEGSRFTEKCQHVEDIFVSRTKLQAWFRSILKSIFIHDRLNIKLNNGREYKVTYGREWRGFDIIHIFEGRDVPAQERRIYFQFVPALLCNICDWKSEREFPQNRVMTWLAVPAPVKDDDFAFMISAPTFEYERLNGNRKLQNSLRLFKAIKDHNKMSYLTAEMVRNLFLLRKSQTDCYDFWAQPLADILEDLFATLQKYTETEGGLKSYWNSKINMLDRLTADQLADLKEKLVLILEKLRKRAKKFDRESLFGF